MPSLHATQDVAMDSADAEPIKSPSEPNKVSLDVSTGGHTHRVVCIDEVRVLGRGGEEGFRPSFGTRPECSAGRMAEPGFLARA